MYLGMTIGMAMSLGRCGCVTGVGGFVVFTVVFRVLLRFADVEVFLLSLHLCLLAIIGLYNNLIVVALQVFFSSLIFC